MRYYFLLLSFFLPLFSLAAEVKTFTEIPFMEGAGKTTGSYAEALYYISISIAAILAVAKLIWVGTKYMLSESVTGKVDAKGSIYNTLLGLVIILSAVLILTTINPRLVNMNILGNIERVNITPPRPNVDRFEIGERVTGSAIADYCEGIIFQDNACIDKYIAALAKSCRENGGRMQVDQGVGQFNVTADWTNIFNYFGTNISISSYACTNR